MAKIERLRLHQKGQKGLIKITTSSLTEMAKELDKLQNQFSGPYQGHVVQVPQEDDNGQYTAIVGHWGAD